MTIQNELELRIEVSRRSTGSNPNPRAHYRLFVGGRPVEYAELTGVKNILAQKLVAHVLVSRMAASNADPADLFGPRGIH